MMRTISVLVENQPGVLSKVVGLFSRRGFNIDSLAVGTTEDKSISRITIVVNGDNYIIEQVEKQLNKLIPIIKVKTLEEGGYISRTLSLVKVSASTRTRPEIMNLAELMGARLVDVSKVIRTLFSGLNYMETGITLDGDESFARGFIWDGNMNPLSDVLEINK